MADVDDAARHDARDELDRHWRAGHLDPADHEARTTRVRNASSRSDLTAALTGLPELPGDAGMLTLGEPAQAPGGGVAPRPSAPDPVESTGPEPRRFRSVLPHHLKGPLIVAAVFAALILSPATGTWVWWMLIPLVAVLTSGPPAGDDGAEQARRRQLRHERRREIHRARRER